RAGAARDPAGGRAGGVGGHDGSGGGRRRGAGGRGGPGARVGTRQWRVTVHADDQDQGGRPIGPDRRDVDRRGRRVRRPTAHAAPMRSGAAMNDRGAYPRTGMASTPPPALAETPHSLSSAGGQQDLESRLGDVEKKLDRLLQQLESSRKASDATDRPRRQ